MDDACRAALARLHRYLDGECEVSIEATIRRHLDECPPCVDRAEFERELRAVIARTCRASAPDGLVERVIWALRP